MAIKNAMTEKFELVELLGKPVLYSNYRIDWETIPDGYYVYDVRHDDNFNLKSRKNISRREPRPQAQNIIFSASR